MVVSPGWRGMGLQGKPAHLPMEQSQSCVDAFQRSPGYDLVPVDTQVYPRSMTLDSIHYEDEQSAGYNSPSAYGLSGTSSGALNDYGSSAWSPKTWNSIMSNNRATNGCMYPDPEANGALTQTPYSYVIPSQGMSSVDLSQSTNPAIGTVSSPDALGPDRTLPTPTSRSHQLAGNATSMGPLQTDEFPSGLRVLPDFKGSFWNPRCGASPNPRNMPHIIPSNAPFVSSSSSDIKCTSTSNNSPGLMFTYPSVPTTTNDVSPLPSAATIPSTTSGNPAHPVFDTLDNLSEFGRVTSDTRPRASFSRDHSSTQRLMALANECTPEIYGYTSSERSKARVTDGNDIRCSTATLMNGLPYTRVRHQDPPNGTFPFNLLPDNLPEYHRAVVENVHRPSISPLGNQGAY